MCFHRESAADPYISTVDLQFDMPWIWKQISSIDWLTTTVSMSVTSHLLLFCDVDFISVVYELCEHAPLWTHS